MLKERRPGEVEVSPFADPALGAQEVHQWASAAGVPVRVPAYGEVRRLGPLTWQVVGPMGRFATGYAEGEGSPANNASVVLLVETHGIRILLGGTWSRRHREALHQALPSLHVDVLKVPHHGSRYQDPDCSAVSEPGLLWSVGRDNTYGHPAEETLALLRRSGMLVRRTDESGDIAVVVKGGILKVIAAR